jgi:ribulose-5-phosphate 4-epimerase/fuculose-1-phosphate aldolase
MLKKAVGKKLVVFLWVGCFIIVGNLTSSYAADQATVTQLKEKLLVANKILDYLKMATPFGHISVRIPGTETFLITSSVAPGVATMDDILVCDMNGKVVEGKSKSTYSEVVIHTGVYKKRKDVNSVVHSHSQYVIGLSMGGHTVLPVNTNAFAAGFDPIAVYEKVYLINQPKQGEEVADLLGQNRTVILKGHGAVIAATTRQSLTNQAWPLIGNGITTQI